MRQEPPHIDYVLVGNGRMATHICNYFGLLNLHIAQWSRSKIHDKKTDFIGASYTLNSLQQLTMFPDKPVLIAVSDDSIEEIVQNVRCHTDSTIVHFSGALCSENIKSNAYSMHPLFTFNNDPMNLDQYMSIPFICEPEGPDFIEIFPALKNPTVRIPNKLRRLYHSVACLASNLPAMIWKECAQIADADLRLDWTLYEPLVIQTLRNAFNNPEGSVTGPIVRKDWGLVNSQLEILPEGLASKLYSAAAMEIKERT